MGTRSFSDDFKRDAVAQITERGYLAAKGLAEGHGGGAPAIGRSCAIRAKGRPHCAADPVPCPRAAGW